MANQASSRERIADRPGGSARQAAQPRLGAVILASRPRRPPSCRPRAQMMPASQAASSHVIMCFHHSWPPSAALRVSIQPQTQQI